MNPWVCPRCGTVWAGWVPKCTCAPPTATTSGRTTVLGRTARVGRCARCGVALDTLTGWYGADGGAVCGACYWPGEPYLAQARG